MMEVQRWSALGKRIENEPEWVVSGECTKSRPIAVTTPLHHVCFQRRQGLTGRRRPVSRHVPDKAPQKFFRSIDTSIIHFALSGAAHPPKNAATRHYFSVSLAQRRHPPGCNGPSG